MRCNHGQVVFFSPTQTTSKVVHAIAQGMGFAETKVSDLTLPGKNASQEHTAGAVVIGVPVYAGRVPRLAVERLRAHARGEGRPAVLVVVYGNRAYDDALLELTHLAEELGFIPVAAAAFIGEHSYSTPEMPVAAGAPHDHDLQTAHEFGAQVRERLLSLDAVDPSMTPKVPGNIPYRDGMGESQISPVSKEDLCTLCGDCVDVCPSQVITLGSKEVKTDVSGCIWCGACIKACPEEGRVWEAPKIREINTFLYSNFSAPNSPEIFL